MRCVTARGAHTSAPAETLGAERVLDRRDEFECSAVTLPERA